MICKYVIVENSFNKPLTRIGTCLFDRPIDAFHYIETCQLNKDNCLVIQCFIP